MPEPTTSEPTTALATDDHATPELLRRTAELAIAWRSSLPTRRVGAHPDVTPESLRLALGGPLPQAGSDPWTVVVNHPAGNTDPSISFSLLPGPPKNFARLVVIQTSP